MNFVFMVTQMVTEYNPQADAQKTGKALEKGNKSQSVYAPFLVKSGFAMARIV